jgi:hypothetical protein
VNSTGNAFTTDWQLAVSSVLLSPYTVNLVLMFPKTEQVGSNGNTSHLCLGCAEFKSQFRHPLLEVFHGFTQSHQTTAGLFILHFACVSLFMDPCFGIMY